MSSLAVLALATPVFGLALSPPVYSAPRIGIDPPALVAPPDGSEAREEPELDPAIRRQLDTRETMADWMTGLGIAAFGALAVSNVIGAIQFHDHFGFSSSFEDTPCERGAAIMDEYCENTVWPYTIASGAATALYVTAASLGMFMPDPLGVTEEPGPRGERVRLHRDLRWITTGLLIAQGLLGAVLSLSDEWFGLDPQDDFGAIQALSFTRLTLHFAAMGSLAVQGSVMLF